MTSTTDATGQILLILTYTLGEQDRETFERIAGAHAAAADTYPGCIRFDLGRDVLHPGRYQLVEQWQNTADLEAHGESEAFHRTMAALKQCPTLQVKRDRYEIA
ncbi:putative quinol monooxygenase [Paractinoplanes maris]|uniref:putative quinol monooxygenase n=1 Tax=Paractinoplanes maris TaxID=1734446 RepID=UPI00201FFAF9|nr:antibiotic biosynthesis monooxygenase [Actinoplanes maris]